MRSSAGQPAGRDGPHGRGGAATTAELVRRASDGQSDAWNDIVDRFGPLVWWVARRHRLSPDDAADVVQTTWLRCVEHLGALRDAERLGPWLATTCRHESLRMLRRHDRALPQDAADPVSALALAADPDPGPFDQVARGEDSLLLHQAIADLPPRQRVLLEHLLGDEDVAYVDLADRLGVPVGSLGPTRRRALDRLRDDARLRR